MLGDDRSITRPSQWGTVLQCRQSATQKKSCHKGGVGDRRVKQPRRREVTCPAEIGSILGVCEICVCFRADAH
jgi:hypothetical protein